jgi:hypothetical protein
MQFNQTSVETLKPENIIFGNIAQKSVPNVQPPSVYNEIILEYNYGDVDNQIRAPFLFELPEVTTSIGITESDIGGRKKFSIPISVNSGSNADHKKTIELMDAIYQSCAEYIFKNRAALKLPKFMRENPEACGFKHPVYYPRDKVTLEIVPGKSPSLYLPLTIRKDSRTIFCGLDEKPVSWDLLKNVQMTFVPLVHFEKIYVGGGKPSLQMKLVSGVVTSVVSKSSVVRQKSTIERLRQSKPELMENVSRQLEELKVSTTETTTSSEHTNDEEVPEVQDEMPQHTLDPSPPKSKASRFSLPPKSNGGSKLQDFLKQ